MLLSKLFFVLFLTFKVSFAQKALISLSLAKNNETTTKNSLKTTSETRTTTSKLTTNKPSPKPTRWWPPFPWRTRTHRPTPRRNIKCQDDSNFVCNKFLHCVHPYDCSECRNVICENCEDVECEGNWSCAKTTLNILGSMVAGTEIDCKGASSCQGNLIFGQFIKELTCNGIQSCLKSTIEVGCLSTDGCDIECTRQASCRQSTVTGVNVKQMKCDGIQSCTSSTIHLDGVARLGCKFEANMQESASNSHISISNLKELSCEGLSSCQNSQIFVKSILDNQFIIECGQSGCANARIDIQVNNPLIQTFKGIKCEGSSSCRGLTVSITSAYKLQMESLACTGPNSCVGMQITLNNVGIVKEVCGVNNACSGLDVIIVTPPENANRTVNATRGQHPLLKRLQF